MNKSFIEKKIEQRAEKRLIDEYDAFIQKLYQSPFCTSGNEKLKIGEKYIFASSTKQCIYPSSFQDIYEKDFPELFKLIERRRQQLCKDESDAIISKLDNLQYLFNN